MPRLALRFPKAGAGSFTPVCRPPVLSLCLMNLPKRALMSALATAAACHPALPGTLHAVFSSGDQAMRLPARVYACNAYMPDPEPSPPSHKQPDHSYQRLA